MLLFFLDVCPVYSWTGPVYISSCILGFDAIDITVAVNPFMSVGNILVTKMEIKSSELNQVSEYRKP